MTLSLLSTFSYKRNEVQFTNDYPEHKSGITALMNAIRRRQQEGGLRLSRARKTQY